MRRLMIWGAALAASGPAWAGELTAPPGAAAQYVFVACARPAEPDMKLDPALKGRARQGAHNEKVRAYNVYIDGVNEYVECLGGEARRDLEAYYAAVTSRLDAEQAAIFERSDALRPGRIAPKS